MELCCGEKGMSKETVLVVAAHPDDEVLGCGGTMAKLAKAGHSVHVAILGEGATSRSAKREEADLGEVEKLRMAAREAGKMLGAAKVPLWLSRQPFRQRPTAGHRKDNRAAHCRTASVDNLYATRR